MTNELVFQILLGLALLLIGGISAYHRRRADAVSDEDISPQDEGWLILTVRRVFGLAIWASFLVYIFRPRWVAWASVPLPEWVRFGAGGLLLTVMPLLMFWLFSSLGNNVTPTVVTREDATLVTSGPYRWVRHPLYTLGFVTWLLFGVLAANGFFWVAAVGAIVVMAFRTPIEEAKLVERHGDAYRAYMRRTGRFLPRLAGRRLPEPEGGAS